MKKWSFAHLCAYMSLAISITLLILWCCNVGGFTVVSLDSFVGVIVALLAIVVTLVVGWQIYNSIELNEKIKEMSTLRKNMSTLWENITSHEKKIEQNMNYSQHYIYILLGLEEEEKKRFTNSFRFFLKSLRFSMLLDSPKHTHHLLRNLERINKKIPAESNYSLSDLNDINTSNDIIKKSSNYDLIKRQYENIYNNFINKINELK